MSRGERFFAHTPAHTALTLLAVLTLLTGCKTPFARDRSPSRDFPAWAAPACQQALDEAHAIIQAKGRHMVFARPVRVEIVPGQRKINGQWCIHSGELSMWVCGLCSDGRLVQIAIDPKRIGDAAAIPYGTLLHEMMHHWLASDPGMDTAWHDPIYDEVYAWKSARKTTGR